MWLGGDHSITLSLLRAYRSHYGRPLGMLHFDAHCDTWAATTMSLRATAPGSTRRVNESWSIPQLTVQIGIRSPASRETREFIVPIAAG